VALQRAGQRPVLRLTAGIALDGWEPRRHLSDNAPHRVFADARQISFRFAMTPAARVAAAIEILDRWRAGEPAERCLTNWARAHRFAGSGDRAAIRDQVFDAIRCRRSFAALGGGEDGRALMIGRLRDAGEDPAAVFTGDGYAPPPLSETEARPPPARQDLPEAVRLDCQDWLVEPLKHSLGDGFAPMMEVLRRRAPVFLRANLLKGSRAAAMASLARDGIEAVPHVLSSTALEVVSNARRVRTSAAFLDGLVEMQDAASQAVVDELGPVAPGRSVLDYCAGGGGKALALAALGADVLAHDADPHRMSDLPGRARRAGAEIRVAETAGLPALAPFDLVFADAPCSGSGAWRRQPAAKWLLSPQRLQDLNRLQDDILEKASGLVSAGGCLAYATCSLLRSENRGAIDRFLARNPEWRVRADRRLTPLEGGDGFYVARLERG